LVVLGMANDLSRRSHDSTDELRGKPEWVGVYVSEDLSFACLGKTSRGKPRSKPESGNPTFRDCRGARGNVTLSFMTKCARLGSIPTPGTGSLHPVAIGAAVEATKLSELSMERVAWRLGEHAGRNVSER